MIRPIRVEDRETFILMVKDFYESEAVLHSIPVEHMIGTYEEALKDSSYIKIYMIESEDRMAGYGQISLTYSNEAGGLVVWLEEIYIKEEFRGLGLGGQFLRFIEKEFENKAKRFRLEICESNGSAKKLYMRNGYEVLDYQQMVRDI